ncbi:MAG TPA: allantoinase AllB [Nocardioidaceae bacterium]|nr:allantoinase AllB [Nocardioidaceae bacterium]
MADYDLLIRAPRVVIGQAEVACTVAIRHGRIAALTQEDALGGEMVAENVVELADDEVLVPGLVDTHVHVNEPGRTEWEGFATATAAAAAGGVTTIVDMPLNAIPPTIDVPALEAKRKSATGQAYVDVGFFGGAVPDNLGSLRALHDAGVFGFKCFMLPSGVDEFESLGPDQLVAAMREIAAFDGVLLAHAEDAETIAAAPAVSGRRYADFQGSRPPIAECRAIELLVRLARETGARVHVVHLSSGEAVSLVAAARAEGIRLTAETCPHYLTLDAADIADGATAYKCCPPIRGRDDQDRLWDGLRAGHLDAVVSDHSPAPPELKSLDTGDFGVAWGGIASLQLGLSMTWTHARRRGMGLPQLVDWMATKPADLVGLPHKGRIAPGADADFAVFAPDDGFVVDTAALRHRHPVTPYAGCEAAGRVRQTWLRGRPISLGSAPRGRLLSRVA